MAGQRIEHDTMGPVKVPADALWGVSTQRAVDNFPVSGFTIGREMVWALASIKAAAAGANRRLRVLPADVANAIREAATDVADGRHEDQFPVDVFQTGSGTSSNTNANEVIAALASKRLGRPVHPNDHVNASQSSNDVFPTAIHVATVKLVVRDLIPALERLEAQLSAQARRQRAVVKAGRTHLQDAVPVTLGQEFGGYARQAELAIERLRAVLPRVGELPLGGTAVGTGLNAPKAFASTVIASLAADLDLPLTEARDHFEAAGGRDAIVECSGVLRTIAVGLYKLATDLRWMASGPATGLAEISLPALQPGSSIMPGKVNPVIPEAVSQVCAQVIGNDAAIGFAGSQGNFELNVMMPVMARNMIESTKLLANVVGLLADKCVNGIAADVERCRRYAESSPSIATALNPLLGYDTVARVVKTSLAEGRTVREVVLGEKLLDDATVDRALDVAAMARPNRRSRS